jgi:hypothetical protein
LRGENLDFEYILNLAAAQGVEKEVSKNVDDEFETYQETFAEFLKEESAKAMENFLAR